MTVSVNFGLGLLFGIGLIVSGMADPAKAQNFLDFAGTWDPSLAFVMAGAVAVMTLGHVLSRKSEAPLLGGTFSPAPTSPVDARLVLGSALFGIGWGLSGFCPGPSLTGLTLAAPGTLVFVPSMIAGIAAARFAMDRLRGEDG